VPLTKNNSSAQTNTEKCQIERFFLKKDNRVLDENETAATSYANFGKQSIL